MMRRVRSSSRGQTDLNLCFSSAIEPIDSNLNRFLPEVATFIYDRRLTSSSPDWAMPPKSWPSPKPAKSASSRNGHAPPLSPRPPLPRPHAPIASNTLKYPQSGTLHFLCRTIPRPVQTAPESLKSHFHRSPAPPRKDRQGEEANQSSFSLCLMAFSRDFYSSPETTCE